VGGRHDREPGDADEELVGVVLDSARRKCDRMKRIAGAVLIVVSLVTVCVWAKPQLERYPTDDGTVAFLVAATNTTKDSFELRSAGRCTARIDGTVQTYHSQGGSGGRRDVAPGKSWKELISLVAGSIVPGGHHPNPDPENIDVYRPLPVQLTPGKHVIAFTCGSEWSDDLAFDWK